MGLETGVTYIEDLNETWPLGSDAPSTLDNHDRNTKTAVKGSFPNLGAVAVTSTAAELNILDGVTKTASDINGLLQDGETITRSGPYATTSGTEVKVAILPTWAQRITISFDQVSVSTTPADIYVNISDTVTFTASGTDQYTAVAIDASGAGTISGASNGTECAVAYQIANTGDQISGNLEINLVDTSDYTYAFSGTMTHYGDIEITNSAGRRVLGASNPAYVVRIRVTTGAFDGGQVTISYS